uniref:C2H2-type domain-containing protein n=1 Tax=Glossina brevipalpis TaxID=37001 RepID=A0A1A9WRG0_9MUSC
MCCRNPSCLSLHENTATGKNSSNSPPTTSVKYSLRRPSQQPSISLTKIENTKILDTDDGSSSSEIFTTYSPDILERETSSPSTAEASTSNINRSAGVATVPINNPTALIALQQLASISSAQCMERLVPKIPKELLAQSESLVYGQRGGKIPRQSSKRLSQFETNRCPLCSRVYRSQPFLNEHMRKEHSILI